MPGEWLQSWLLTYVLHSTLLLGAVWLVARRLPVAVQDTLWRTALVGGVLTATLQVAIGLEAFGGRMALPDPEVVVVPPVETTVEVAVDEPAPAAMPVQPPAPVAPQVTRTWSAYVPGIVGMLWGLGALIALVRFARARRTLRVRMAERSAISGGPLRAMLDRLTAGAGFARYVRLTHARGLASPVALGFVRREICLPRRAIDGLAPAHQEAMLAHELAHHLRADPLWLSLGRWIEAVFFFQPLNALANRRLRETAEILCDEWAVGATGRRRELAECLTVVAEWVIMARSLPLPAMAQRGATLERRVRRLLDEDGAPARASGPLRAVAMLVPLAAVLLLAPVIGAKAGTKTPEGSVASFAPTDDLASALDALDDEMAVLRTEMSELLALLQEAGTHAPILERGAASLRRRLATLEADRTALLQRIRTNMETDR